jgi:hypothetical protein
VWALVTLQVVDQEQLRFDLARQQREVPEGSICRLAVVTPRPVACPFQQETANRFQVARFQSALEVAPLKVGLYCWKAVFPKVVLAVLCRW